MKHEGEGSFEFLTERIGCLHKDLLAIWERTERRFDQIDGRFDRIDNKFDRLDHRFSCLDGKIDAKIGGLAKSLPAIVRDAVRDALAGKARRK